MASLKFRNCSIRFPLVFLGAFLVISIVTAFNYSWPLTRNALSPYFSESQIILPPSQHPEVEEVRQVRIAIEEAAGSFVFILEQPDSTVR